MKRLVAVLALALSAACSPDEVPPGGGGPPAAAAPAATQAEAEMEAEVRKRFLRPHLRDYLMLPGSFVGGKFPKETAALLREVQQITSGYITHLESTGGDQAVLATHRALETFVSKSAGLYELMAAQPLDSVKDMREGLVISDAGVHAQYNRLVDEVNAAHERLDTLIRSLPAGQQSSFRRMSIATIVRK